MPDDVIITPAPELGILCETLIRQHVPELLECSILPLFTSQGVPCTPRKCNPLLRYLASPHLEGAPRAAVEEGPDFLLLVNVEEWGFLLPGQQEPFLYHRLLHIGREEKRDGGIRWVLQPHSFEEFGKVLQEYGLHNDAAKQMGRIIQPELDLVTERRD